jgi:very-short-patch-repair endonuclease
MRSVDQHLRTNGGVLPYSALDRAGYSRSAVRAELQRGSIARVRNGWFAVPDAKPDVIRAVRVGGTATAARVARLHSLWVHDDGLLHVRVRHSAGRLAAAHERGMPLDRTTHRVCVHYSTKGGLDRARDPLTMALAEMFACAAPGDVLPSIDSALEKGVLQVGHLDLIRERMPRSRRALIDRVDPGSQSGLETRIRLLLHSRRIPFRTQVEVEGVGRVDLVVGERLVIEADGRAFHTGAAFEEDRRRDFALAMQGYLVLRLSYRQIIDDWERTRAGILALLARGEHRWAGRGPYAPELPASALLQSSADENV